MSRELDEEARAAIRKSRPPVLHSTVKIGSCKVSYKELAHKIVEDRSGLGECQLLLEADGLPPGRYASQGSSQQEAGPRLEESQGRAYLSRQLANEVL